MLALDSSHEALSWAKTQLGESIQCDALCPDVSARRYYRLVGPKQPVVLMDSAAEPESAQLFYSVSQAFQLIGVRVPEVIAFEPERSWMVLEDFGAERLLETLIADRSKAHNWYSKAWQVIDRIQSASGNVLLDCPVMDASIAYQESVRCINELLPNLPAKHRAAIDCQEIEEALKKLAVSVASQPACLAHRDYHAGNLMCLPDQVLGVLDFQSVIHAPVSYDLVSLLRDCYIDWPMEMLQKWLREFHDGSARLQTLYPNFDSFLSDFDETGLQRHLKCVGLFASLIAKGQARFHTPLIRTLGYAKQVCEADKQWQAFLPLIDLSLEHYA